MAVSPGELLDCCETENSSRWARYVHPLIVGYSPMVVPPGDCLLATVSPPHPGDRRALTREFARGAGGMEGSRDTYTNDGAISPDI